MLGGRSLEDRWMMTSFIPMVGGGGGENQELPAVARDHFCSIPDVYAQVIPL